MDGHQKITIQDIYVAYRKFKTYVYYDTSNLLLRQQLADFELQNFSQCKNEQEFKEAFKKKFEPLLIIVNQNEKRCVLINYLKKISCWLVPKKIRASASWKQEAHFITNSIPMGEFKIMDFNILVDMPIEIHILSVIWVMFVGKKLNRFISKDNYAYRLSVFRHDSGKTIDGDVCANEDLDKSLRLFEPYYTGYQRWRDNALDKAVSSLNENKDVVILSMDISRYYYSVRLNINEDLPYLVSQQGETEIFNTLEKHLNSLLQSIHKKYSSVISQYTDVIGNTKFNEDRYPLPVGLLSSGVLANLYLKDFDEYVTESITPSYYGRYVDDILMVFVGKKVNLETECNSEKNVTYSPIKDFIKRHLVRDNESLEDSEMINGHLYLDNATDESRAQDFNIIIKARGSKLLIKEQKLVMEYFKPHESRAAINIFRKRLQQNSSEYRLLPFEYDIDKEFDQEAFKLDLEENDSKIRSLQGINEDKYGASKYLAHKIFLSTLPFDADENDQKYREASAEQILTYFRGHNSLCMFSLWEKVATYFIVNNEMQNLRKFYRQQIEAINCTRYESDKTTETACRQGNLVEDELKQNLHRILLCGMGMAFALNPSKLDSFKIRSSKIATNNDNVHDLAELAVMFRKTYLFRHQYQYLRGLCFTEDNLNAKSSIMGKDVLDKKIGRFSSNGVARLLSPVFMRIENIALLHYYHQLGSMMEEK